MNVVAFEPVTVGPELRHHTAIRGFLMKKLSFAVVGAAALALAACGGRGDDAAGENVQENLEAQAENLEAAADNTANAAEAAALENQADALQEEPGASGPRPEARQTA